MAYQQHLEAIDKKQAAISREMAAGFARLEEKLDALSAGVSLSETAPVKFTPEDFEPIDGVGPATAKKIVEVIENK